MMTRRLWLAALGLATLTGFAIAADPKLKFEVYQDAKEQYRWRLKAANGQVLATPGQGYKAKRDCLNSVERIKADATTKLKFEVYEDKRMQHRFRIKAANGQTIGTSSESYKAEADAEKAVQLIKDGAKTAEVVEVKEK